MQILTVPWKLPRKNSTALQSKMPLLSLSPMKLVWGATSDNEIQRKFTDMQGWMNQYIAEHANEVWLMVSGIEVKVK